MVSGSQHFMNGVRHDPRARLVERHGDEYVIEIVLDEEAADEPQMLVTAPRTSGEH